MAVEYDRGAPPGVSQLGSDSLADRMQIRRARREDAEFAIGVVRRSIAELCHADHNGDNDEIAKWLENKTSDNMGVWISEPSNVVLVAVDSDAIVGVAAMTSSGHVTLNYVDPAARFSGVSKALLARIEQEAVSLGLARLTLSSTWTAQPFYNALGFVDAGTRVVHDEDYSCLDMKKDL